MQRGFRHRSMCVLVAIINDCKLPLRNEERAVHEGMAGGMQAGDMTEESLLFLARAWLFDRRRHIQRAGVEFAGGDDLVAEDAFETWWSERVTHAAPRLLKR